MAQRVASNEGQLVFSLDRPPKRRRKLRFNMAQAVHEWLFEGDLVIAMTSAGSISDIRWDKFVEDLKSKDFRRFLGVSVGSTDANSVQRKKVNDIIKAKQVPVCLITDEKLIRGMATAASWFGIDIKAFSWADIDGALKYLSLSKPTEDLIRRTITTFYDKYKSK